MSIEWTDETIIAEFKKHLDYWREKLRLRDLDVEVLMGEPSTAAAWCAIERANCGANPHRARLVVRRSMLSGTTRRDVWETAAHELVHAMNWAMLYAVDSLRDHFAVAQFNMLNALMGEGNEELAYKWEALLSAWFAADAPQD